MIKRFIDLAVSLALLVILAPIMVLVSFTILLNDKGPVIYRQTRVGLNGSEFSIMKFRSMIVNADRVGGYSTSETDHRITAVGRFIRKTSIDELPQLFNVLVGHMSLVGPRPDVPAQKSLYSVDEWKLRHAVRPGITGLAQATLRSQATHEQRKAMDLYYVENSSLKLDCEIILKTINQVIFKGGN